MRKKRERNASYLVFISYSSKDKWIARQLARLIESAGARLGIRTFLDEKDIQGGESIPETIREALEHCDEFLILLTPHSINRPWVLIELGAAWGQRKHVVAIVSHLVPAKLPAVIAMDRAVDLNDFDTYLAQLLNRAKSARKR